MKIAPLLLISLPATIIASGSSHSGRSHSKPLMGVFQYHPLASFENWDSLEAASFNLSSEAPNLEECAWKCANNVDCASFDYSSYYWTCTAYQNFGPFFNTEVSGNDYTGVKVNGDGECSDCFTRMMSFSGSNISFVDHALIHNPKSVIYFPRQPTDQECSNKCRDMDDCVVFTYDASTGNCYGLTDPYAKSVVETSQSQYNWVSGKKFKICPICDFPCGIVATVEEQSTSTSH